MIKGEQMKERLLEVIDLLNHEKEDLEQLSKDVSFPETRLARSAAMTNRRVREILEEVLEGIEDRVNECVDVVEQHPTKACVVVLLRTSLHKRLRAAGRKKKKSADLNLSNRLWRLI